MKLDTPLTVRRASTVLIVSGSWSKYDFPCRRQMQSVRSPERRLRRPWRLSMRENLSWILMKLDSGFRFKMNRIMRFASARKSMFWICSCISLPRYRLKWMKKSFRFSRIGSVTLLMEKPRRERANTRSSRGLQRHWDVMERRHSEKWRRKDEFCLSHQRAVCRMPRSQSRMLVVG